MAKITVAITIDSDIKAQAHTAIYFESTERLKT